jgi:hypothetical protein
MRGRRGARWVLPLGLAAAGVLAFGIARREDLVEWYHFARLRREPAYLTTIITEPEGTPARAAVLRFGASPEGREALVAGYFADLEGVVDLARVFGGMPYSRLVLWICLEDGILKQRLLMFDPPYGLRDLEPVLDMALASEHVGRLRAFQETLMTYGCHRLPVPRHPDLLVSTSTREDPFFVPPEGCRYPLRIERLEPSLPPAHAAIEAPAARGANGGPPCCISTSP